MKSHFDEQDNKLNESMEKTKDTRERSAGLEQEARQSRLAPEADAPTDTKTRKHTEGSTAAERVISGDNSYAEIDPDRIYLASFEDDSTGPRGHPCSRDDVLVDNGAAAPKPCLSPVEMRTRTAAGGLLAAGKVSTATRITFYQPRLRFCPTEETNSERTSIQYASYYSSFWRIKNQLPPFWRRVIETESRQTLVFDSGGSTGRLRASPFMETWRALFCGDLFVRVPDVAGVFFGRMRTSECHFPE